MYSHFSILKRKIRALGERLSHVCRLALIVLACSITSISASAQVNAEQVLNIGRNVLSMEDYLLAIQYFNLAIKAKPYLADAYFLRGLAKLSLDDYDGAIADCNLALERNKFKSEAYKVRGFALMNQHKDSLAIEDFNRGLEYNPDDKYFLYYKGVAQSELKRFDAADSTFRHLLRRNPGFEDGFVARARMNLMRGDTVQAIADLDHALKLSKSLLNAYLLKADIAARRKLWEESLENMDEAVRLRPEEPDLYVNRAYLRYNNEDFFGAMSDYNYALRIDPGNEAALFNRALLRTEVKELQNAENDFSEVLKMDPRNFYALYNRGLINLQLGNYKKALADFKETAERYKRFHPAYYAMAECYRNMGNMRQAVANIKKGDALVANYVANPTRNPLDRPTIAQGSNGSRDPNEPETDEEFMDRFNRLMTNEDVAATQLSFNDKIKGRVQDRNIKVSPESEFSISFFAPEAALRNLANYFRDLDNLNRRQYISRKLYLRAGDPLPADESDMGKAFAIEEDFSRAINAAQNPRPIDYLGRGIARTMLKNYDAAIEDLTKAIEGADDFATAHFARAYAYTRRYMMGGKDANSSDASAHTGSSRLKMADLQLAIADLDAALKINPGLAYAWFNKGNIYYEIGDFTSAMQCFEEAIRIYPEFGEAFYNRGLSYMQQGNRERAFADLSKAGELGVLPSYNLLKRMK